MRKRRIRLHLSRKQMILMYEQNIFFKVLFDFLKELPPDFDPKNTSLLDAYDIIIKFMEKHDLLNEEDQ
jgi:hypothetical protein